MSTHNICFHGEIRKIFIGYPPLSRSRKVKEIWYSGNILADYPGCISYPVSLTIHISRTECQLVVGLGQAGTEGTRVIRAA